MPTPEAPQCARKRQQRRDRTHTSDADADGATPRANGAAAGFAETCTSAAPRADQTKVWQLLAPRSWGRAGVHADDGSDMALWSVAEESGME